VVLRLYDTATRRVRDFEPLEPGRVGVYLCGATVQSPPHIGHIRSGVAFDILCRCLVVRGFRVTFIRNVTDIDDKILQVAAAEDVPWWQVAARNELAFGEAYRVLGCLPPSYEPRATGHVPEMIQLMRRLIDRGRAYAAGGDVYFDVGSWPSYGALSGQRLEAVQAAEDTDVDTHKRDPRDFALWKAAKPGEPSWETPWGAGRPGWHLECSAMAEKYLGSTFDIHAGGLDLVFPHHENETAQSRAAGGGFARYWLHNGLLRTAGEKMSKSVGNSLLIPEVLKLVRPVELRYYLGQAHYRSHIDYSEAALHDAAAAYQRVEGFVRRAGELVGDVDTATAPTCAAFEEAMDDDLGVPAALAAVHDTVREGNRLLAAGEKDAVRTALASCRRMLAALGLDPRAEPWASSDPGADLHRVVETVVGRVLAEREAARARKDYATADALRRSLADAGVLVEDTPSGPRWSLAQDS
jgi:cysteinyl-tRNA synthetase